MNWQWNEFQQVGTDYESEQEVAAYDKRMRELRDIDGENRRILNLLQLREGASLLEIGTGTGALVRSAAKAGFHAVGIDISPVMLQYAKSRADAEGLSGVVFEKAGFLSYGYGTERFDGIVSGLAFHHLPDTWKAIALRRIHAALKPGGRFLLLDVVFDWKQETPEAYFERLIRTMPQETKEPFARHIAQEYSTLTWIMTGLLERVGFQVELDQCDNDFLHLYSARKPDSD